MSTTISDAHSNMLRSLAERSGKSLSEVLDDMLSIALLHPRIASLVGDGSPDGPEVVLMNEKVGPWTTPQPCRGSERPLRVLVVEDDPYSREILTIRLEAMGCQVRLAENAEEAFGAASQEKPDLLIVDLKLQDNPRAGFELIERLRDTPAMARIPIIIHSVYVRNQSELPEPLPEVMALLPKPFKTKDLVEIVKMAYHEDDPDSGVLLI